MAEIIDNISSMEPAPLVNTNEPMVEQPMVEPESGEGDPVKKGATSTKKDTTPKYDLDNTQLSTVATETNKKLAEFSALVFKTAGVAPTYKGKTITDLSTISTLIDKDGKAAQQLYQQATAALESPDLDEDSIASFYTQMYEIESGFNRSSAIKQQISKSQKVAASFLDAKRKGGNSRYSLLVNDNGDFVSKEEYKRKVQKYYADEQALFLKNNPRESTFDYRGNPTQWIRTDMPNPMAGKMYKDKSGKWVQPDTRPKLQGTTEGWDMSFSSKMVNDAREMNDRIENYDADIEKIKEEYNINKEIPTIKTLQEGVFKQGAGDAKTSLSSSFSFDGDDFLNRDDKGNILKVEDAGSTDKNANIFKKEFKNLYNLVDRVKNMEGAIIVSGSPEDYSSGVPDKTDDKVKATLAKFNTDLDEHVKTFFAHSKKLTPTKLKGRPAGNLNFQPIASGNENYQAYHITFSEGYSNKYAESEKKQKEHPEYKKGLTIFVPVAKAGETRIGAASLRGSNISNTEAAINMSPDNTYRFAIPNGGAIEASKIGDSAYTITGNLVEYNLQNGRYDTVPINPMKYEIGSSMALDMDGHIKRNVDTIIMNLIQNRMLSKGHKAQRGVTDPNLLKRN